MIRISSGRDLASLAPENGEHEPLPSPTLGRARALLAWQQHERQERELQQASASAHAAAAGATASGGQQQGQQGQQARGGQQPHFAGDAAAAAAAAREAAASLGRDELPPDVAAELDAAVSEQHLLQFGAVLGEASSLAALVAQGLAEPLNQAGSLYGFADSEAVESAWEQVVAEAQPGVAYWGWRRPLRRGLHMYMTRTVFAGVAPAHVAAFMCDDAYRLQWDDAAVALAPLAAAPGRQLHDSDVMYSRVRFPKVS
jgi:hypothetical protein